MPAAHGEPRSQPRVGSAPRTWLSLAEDSRKMAPHDSASFFPSSVLTSRLKTQQNSRGQAGCATGTHTHVGPPEPPLPLQGQVRLVPHQHHGHAAGTGRIRAQTTLGPPPREGQHLPCLPPALVQLLVEGLDHLEAVGTRGHPGTAFPLRGPPCPRGPIPKSRGFLTSAGMPPSRPGRSRGCR